MIARRNLFEQLPTIAIEPDDFQVLFSAEQFRQYLIQAIRQATHRIYIVALYLEADEAGKEILTELYAAKQRNPGLEINVCVDWHRAQRGLIGAESSAGNAAMYESFAQASEHQIPVYGIPVRGKEVFGVLHLKGFIIDDEVIYSGASLNNVYLQYQNRYRFDRYHVIQSKELADSMAGFIHCQMLSHPAVNNLATPSRPVTKELKPVIRQFRNCLSQAEYPFQHQEISPNHVGITPLVGIGKRSNHLNLHINHMISRAQKEIFICTPYFNFPKRIAAQVKRALKRGVKVNIIVGDKTANDFYIPPEEKFKAIGGLPYLYELNLRRFAKANEDKIASRQLSIHVWKHDNNSFHLKGIWVDRKYMLITGNNLNPRAWRLDLENGLLIQDQYGHLTGKFEQEFENILQHTQLICTYKQIDALETYPPKVQRLIKRILRVKADRILKYIL
jgi:CDP-diacylglycerol--serine O-phosphatidyltransferase